MILLILVSFLTLIKGIVKKIYNNDGDNIDISFFDLYLDKNARFV